MDPEIKNTFWDVIIIGTGMGGSVIGYELAKGGKRVLFVEKGTSRESPDAINGQYPEALICNLKTSSLTKEEIFKKSGRSSEYIEDRSKKRPKRFIPFIGEGYGGSTALYGMVMQRFAREDFSPKQNHPDAIEASLQDTWPITYEDLRIYYQKAEQMLGAKGMLDPLRVNDLDSLPPRRKIKSGTVSYEVYNFLKNKGMHVYQPPLACDLVIDCLNCQGVTCPKNCKNDSNKIFLQPAIKNFGAAILDDCRAIKLEADTSSVTGVVCEKKGKKFTLTGNIIILAAGALQTPCILLQSKSNFWPKGLANNSDRVGRNFMRHLFDLYLIFPPKKLEIGNGLKEIYFNDFYHGKEKLGIVQSFGAPPSTESIMYGLEENIKQSLFKFIFPLFVILKPFIRMYLTKMLSNAFILTTTIEDMPLLGNKIYPLDNGTTAFEYTISDYDRKRIIKMRKKMAMLLKPYKFFLLKQAEENKTYISLANGTCRFGEDPKTSVLDKNNKAHDLKNLYIVDSSFFPSSGAFNSSLTIAANAMRVARHILEMNKKIGE